MRSLFTVSPRAERILDTIARWWTFGAVALLALLTVTVGLPEDPDGRFASINEPVQLGLLGLALVGALISYRMEAPAGLIEAVTAFCLGLFAAVEYRPVIAILVTTMFAVPAVLLWIVWQHEETVGKIAALAGGTFLLMGGGYAGATMVYDHFFGPTHPESEVSEIEEDEVRWVWSGAVTTDGATVVARVDDDAEAVQLLVIDATGEPVTTEAATPDEEGIVRLQVGGLQPDTRHDYVVVVDGIADSGRGVGSFHTPAEGAMSFTVALGSCARTGSNGAVFDAIAAEDPLLYLLLGDIHYGNLDSVDEGPHRDALDHLLTQPAQAALFRQAPIAYVWDDHDYGPNDADATSPSREAVQAAYREVVPHYPLVDAEAIHQAFTIGRVRFVVTDPRSERQGSSMLGADQRTWLIDELVSASRSHGLVVWANGAPWIGEPDPQSDSWAGFAEERAEIAAAIAAAGVDNLVMVSGDAHMLAIDDGTNSGYAGDGTAGFPVFHAAALDRPGSLKGGPYSEGFFPGGGQYGVMEITDDGTHISVEMHGRDWTGDTLVSYVFETTG